MGATVGAGDACGANVSGTGASVSTIIVGVGAVTGAAGAGVATSATYQVGRKGQTILSRASDNTSGRREV